METRSWDQHYTSKKSELLYPDENLVRMLSRAVSALPGGLEATAIDLGCGSGRHIRLLFEMGISRILGMDTSQVALLLSRNAAPCLLLQGNNSQIPLKSGSVDFAIAWGSLHYNRKEDLPLMLNEIFRILKKNGSFFATLRSSRDTHMKKGTHLGNDTWITALGDISGSIASFYDEDELIEELSIFSTYEYGLIERSLMGDLASRISHWVIQARK